MQPRVIGIAFGHVTAQIDAIATPPPKAVARNGGSIGGAVKHPRSGDYIGTGFWSFFAHRCLSIYTLGRRVTHGLSLFQAAFGAFSQSQPPNKESGDKVLSVETFCPLGAT